MKLWLWGVFSQWKAIKNFPLSWVWERDMLHRIKLEFLKQQSLWKHIVWKCSNWELHSMTITEENTYNSIDWVQGILWINPGTILFSLLLTMKHRSMTELWKDKKKHITRVWGGLIVPWNTQESCNIHQNTTTTQITQSFGNSISFCINSLEVYNIRNLEEKSTTTPANLCEGEYIQAVIQNIWGVESSEK